MASGRKVDKPFLFVFIVLIVLGLLAREASNYSSVAFSQTVLGLFLGTLVMIVVARSDMKIWKKFAFYFMIIAIVLNILVLFPQIGFEHAGARRWIRIGSISFQTSEFLKLAFILYFAAWCAGVKEKIKTFRWGFLPLLILIGISTALLIQQPDTDNLILVVIAGVAMFVAAGGQWRHVLILALAGAVGLAFLAYTKPSI